MVRGHGWAEVFAGVLAWVGGAVAQERPATAPGPIGRFEKCGYVSRIDDATIEYALWYPHDYDASRPWPLIVFLHGSGEGGSWIEPTRPNVGIPVRTVKADLPFLVVSPLMRGTWSIHGPAERDVLDTIADVQARANVDPDRIHLTGFSLGGFAGWAIAARHPHVFASASLFCGGGQPELTTNLRHLPTWVFHGSADQHVRPGESRRMVRFMESRDLPVRYTELPGVKHLSWTGPYAGNDLYTWMGSLTRVRAPQRITYRTRTLRHNRAYWATIGSVVDFARPALVDVFAPPGPQIHVHAENVARLILDPPRSATAPDATPEFFVNGRSVEASPVEDGWELELVPEKDAPLRKRHGLSGPITDVLHDRFVVVTATSDDATAAATWSQVARAAFKWTEALTYESFRFVGADQVTSEMIQSSHLICFGTVDTHPLLAQMADRLPLVFSDAGLIVRRTGAGLPVPGGNAGAVAAMVMIYPNPLNPERYVVVCSGWPRAVAALASATLRPPYLSPPPTEDLVVITADGRFPLAPSLAPSRAPNDKPRSSDSPPSNDEPRPNDGPRPRDGSRPNDTPRWMAEIIPPRGPVFDGHWQLPEDVVRRLTDPGSEPSHPDAPGSG